MLQRLFNTSVIIILLIIVQGCSSFYEYNSTCFVDRNVGWIVGREEKSIGSPQPIIIKTTNGGRNWNRQDSDIEGVISNIYFTDPNNGFIFSSDYCDEAAYGLDKYKDNVPLRPNVYYQSSTDGGKTWNTGLNKTLNPTYLSYYSKYCVNEYIIDEVLKKMHPYGSVPTVTIGIVNKAGENNKFLDKLGRTEINKRYLNGLDIRSISEIYIYDSSVYWAVGGRVNGWFSRNALIFNTTDGGDSWISQLKENDCPHFLNTVFFINDKIGWAAGYGGSILKSTDGGLEWNPQYCPAVAEIKSICFIDNDNGWIVGQDIILNTTNGGLKWNFCEPKF